MADSVIQTKGLTRYFGRRCVVDDLNLDVPAGCVFGFLGRNGCGKTTTIRMLLGLLEPTRGSCRVLGQSSGELSPATLTQVGYLTESHSVYGWMRVRECGWFQSRFYLQWNDDIFRSVIDYFRLDPNARAGGLSRGERAGLCLAMTLAPQPRLLVLDDPALGLDPVARRALLEAMVYVTRGQDRTIFFSSHLLSDVDRVADKIAIIDRGRLHACCEIETFRRRVRRLVARFPKSPPDTVECPGLLDSIRSGQELAVTIVGSPESAAEALRRQGAERVEVVPIDLEEAFISYVGHRGSRSLLVSSLGA